MRVILAILFMLVPLSGSYAQMLAFNIEAPPELNITILSDGILEFGTLLQNQGLSQIMLNDAGTEVISIEGQFNQNVTVTITPPAALQLDATNTLPYTLRASYSNQGENNKGQAISFNGSNVATFRIKEGGAPQGGRRGGGPPSGTAYLYIYGDITVGNVNAGTYSGIINIFVEYE